jgi:hypothetical protein
MIRKFDDGTIEVILGDGDVKLMPGRTTAGMAGIAFAQMNAQYPVGHRFPEDVGESADKLGACVKIIFQSERDIINFIVVLCEASTGTEPGKGDE